MYKSIKHCAECLDCSTKTVERIIEDMKRTGKYKKGVFLERPRRVKWETLIEFCERGNE